MRLLLEYCAANPRGRDDRLNERRSIFYGWWIVWASFVAAVVSWSLGVFGTGVYLHTICQSKGWSISLVSSSVTIFYLTGAACSILVGRTIAQVGPRHVMLTGGISLAIGVVGMGRVSEPWHVYLNFIFIGVSYACLGTTAISTTLAPWFERQQGRVVAIALLGASVGGMIGTPLLLFGIEAFGFERATLIAGAITLAIVSPIAIFILRHRPQQLGLLPDGDLTASTVANGDFTQSWDTQAILHSTAFLSVVVAFGIALSMQLGFLTHHVSLIAPQLGESGASVTVSATGIAAFIGRLLLSRYADHVDLRFTTGSLLAIACAAFLILALCPNQYGLICGSILYGLTLGNITSLSPIIIRREFGAASFGIVYGVASTGIGLASAFGPTIWGMLHDIFGGYAPALLLSAMLDLLAAVIVIATRTKASPP